jgi:hypothetical protein
MERDPGGEGMEESSAGGCKGPAQKCAAFDKPRQDNRPGSYAALVHGRLIDNITKGTDKAAQSAKILGTSRDLNMWTPDMQMGLVILTMPQRAIDNKESLLRDED